jgi:hypothetical protein
MHRATPPLIAAIAAAAALTALAGCSALPGGSPGTPHTARDCFNVRSITGFNYIEDDTIRVSVSPSRSYDLETQASSCFNLRHANTISLSTGPSNFLCVGDGASVSARVVTDQGDRCLVTAVSRAPEEPDESGESEESDVESAALPAE